MQYGHRIIDDLLEGLTCYLREKALGQAADLEAWEWAAAGASCPAGTEATRASLCDGAIPPWTPRRLCVLVCPQHAVSGFGKRIARETP